MSENDDAYNTYRLAVYSPYHSALKSLPNNNIIMLFGSRLYISIQQACHNNNINVY